MSFRTRLITFFVLIVVVPMLALGFLVFRLISDSEQGKSQARANGLASAAASLYDSESATARADAQTIARDPALLRQGSLRARLPALVARAGLARITVTRGSSTVADTGNRAAIAPGVAIVAVGGRGAPLAITVSEITASEYARRLNGPGVAVAVRQGGRTLSSTLGGGTGRALPRQGPVTVRGAGYRVVTQAFRGFGPSPVEVSVLSAVSVTSSSITASQIVAAAFIAGFLLLALSFSLLASRALQGQLSHFLTAARRLGSGDFSSLIRTQGHDEFAALGEEFNSMSSQLARRLEELSQERARLRDAIHRIGETFASNLDRPALLELALKTAIDAVQADCGRISFRATLEEPLAEFRRQGSLDEAEAAVVEAEREALRTGELGERVNDGVSVVSAALILPDARGRARGLITVVRRGRPFTDAERDVLHSLAAQAMLALDNVELHFQVQRQAVTDELTGLANHGRFQDLLGSEIEQVRRYHHPLGLIMLDIDDFKAVNDTYGHQQGDVVLRHVARVLQQNSREPDSPARYGGEELALILPHTDLDGAYAIAERVRTAIGGLRIPRTDGQGALRITASIGVAASTHGDKDGLIADADAALYEAKRAGKNRTVRARTKAVFGAG